MNPEQIEVEALKLSTSERARLAERLLESLDSLSDEENERLWAEEAQRRDDEIKRGDVTPHSADHVMRELRSRLPWDVDHTFRA